jgi:hydroxymethylpyrimidine/phosphomethylpyrimidine kinase
MPKVRPYCLTIGGFDPSGGAGVLADIKAFEQHRCQGLAVLTANTIQTENSFEKINWIDEATIFAQLSIILDRYNIKFVKIGLLQSGEFLEKIISLLTEKQPNVRIVWDPILSATAGGEFDENRFSNFASSNALSKLIITPNIPEFELLKLSKSTNIVYLKGGHAEKKGYDVLYFDGKEFPFAPQVKTNFTKHGTGCIFSAALLANLSLEYPMIKACLRAKRYVEKRLVSNPSLLAYHK